MEGHGRLYGVSVVVVQPQRADVDHAVHERRSVSLRRAASRREGTIRQQVAGEGLQSEDQGQVSYLATRLASCATGIRVAVGLGSAAFAAEPDGLRPSASRPS